MGKAGIVPFAFGVPANIRPNVLIANIAARRARELDAPIYTQIDVSINTICQPVVEVEYFPQTKPKNPPPTLRIARGAVRWAKRRGISEFWVVAAKPHLWRCLRDLRYAVREAGLRIPVLLCREVHDYPEEGWFCKDSIQFRTQAKEAWEKRERILRRIPMWLYKLVAG